MGLRHAFGIELCTDCLCYHANGDVPDDRPELPETIARVWAHPRAAEGFRYELIAGGHRDDCPRRPGRDCDNPTWRDSHDTCQGCPFRRLERGETPPPSPCDECQAEWTQCSGCANNIPDPDCYGCDCNEDEGSFSWSGCDSCGSRLGGTLYLGTVLEYAPDGAEG